MATYRELVYIVLDELKFTSDDNHFQEEHVLFLLDKYRMAILKQRYSDIRKEIPDSNFQTICIDLERSNAIDGSPCTGADYMKSIKEIPNLSTLSDPKISSIDYFQGNFAYTNNERFKYVGNNKYLKNQIYGTIAPDNHLYLRSSNPQLYYLDKVKVKGIFEDSIAAAELQCDKGDACDIMDMNYPLEVSLIPVVTEMIIKELGAQKYQASDDENNAKDDLSDIASYIRTQLANGRRSDLYKDFA